MLQVYEGPRSKVTERGKLTEIKSLWNVSVACDIPKVIHIAMTLINHMKESCTLWSLNCLPVSHIRAADTEISNGLDRLYGFAAYLPIHHSILHTNLTSGDNEPRRHLQCEAEQCWLTQRSTWIRKTGVGFDY